MGSLYIALVHFPVLNKLQERIASAITSIDLHDLGRLARTYEIPFCYVITPLIDQQILAKRLIDHWCKGIGKNTHPNRAEALERLKLVNTIGEAVRDIEQREGQKPECWATSAQKKYSHKIITFNEASKRISLENSPVLLLFGTAWGLAPEVMDMCSAILEPVRANSSYNHLSVRCAAAIIVDRLLGEDKTR